MNTVLIENNPSLTAKRLDSPGSAAYSGNQGSDFSYSKSKPVMSDRVLCVDDDANILASYQRSFRTRFSLETALGAEEALDMLARNGPYAVLIADMRMPGMNGIELLMEVRRRAPDTVRIMLTGNADLNTSIEAVNKGHVFQFLTKPCPTESFALAIDLGLKQYRLITAERELLENTLGGTIKMVTDILALADGEMFGRTQLAREYARSMAVPLRMEQTWELEVAALLSPLGKVTIPAPVLEKTRSQLPLNGKEREMLRRVPEIGSRLLFNIPRLEAVARIVRYQEKQFNGAGVPEDSVSGENLPLGSRILKLVLDFIEIEASGTTRVKAFELMRTRDGWYDPELMEVAEAVLVTDSAMRPAGRAIESKDLQIGLVVVSAVETKEGVLILPAGTRISAMLLEKIRNFSEYTGLKEPLYVED